MNANYTATRYGWDSSSEMFDKILDKRENLTLAQAKEFVQELPDTQRHQWSISAHWKKHGRNEECGRINGEEFLIEGDVIWF